MSTSIIRAPSKEPLSALLSRPPPTDLSTPAASPPSRTLSGLRELAVAYTWGGVLELATSLLADDDDAAEHNRTATLASSTSAGLSHRDGQPPAASAIAAGLSTHASHLLPHERLLIEAYRGLALVQTRMLDRATLFLDDLGSLSPMNPKYRYESYPHLYPSHPPGSFVPFELLLLSVEVRVRSGDASAIADCYELRPRFPQHRLILLSALVGYHLRAQQHDTAIELARELVLRQGSSARALFFYGRVLLHVGDFGEAKRVFSAADTASDATDQLRHVHHGLLLASQGDFLRALAENDLAVRAADAAAVAGGEDEKEKDRGVGEEGESGKGKRKRERRARHVRVFADCNAAICLMHLGRLADAIERLECCLRNDPEAALDEGLVFNLCTMYDLGFPDEAEERKQVLHRLASRYGRQGFNLDMTLSSTA